MRVGHCRRGYDRLFRLKRKTATCQREVGDLARLRSVLPERCYVEDTDLVQGYRRDWLGQFTSPVKDGETPWFVIRPESTEQVSKVLQVCNEERIGVVPQGGNTGLVGGSVPVRGDEVILSMGKMNEIIAFDKVAGILTCQSGCILDELSDAVREDGFMMPLDLGASGSCMIGGNVATNAGGIRFLRYGSLRANVLGLKVVLANGQVMDLKSRDPVRKDNTGYDLKQLFIGSEGTLGVITEVSIITPPRPKAVNVVLLGLADFDHVLETLGKAKSALGEILSAFEFWDLDSMQMVLKERGDVQYPLGVQVEESCRFFVLLETHGSNEEHDAAKLEAFLQEFQIGTMAEDVTRRNMLWELREGIPVALRSKGGRTYKYDVSVAPRLTNELTEHVKRGLLQDGWKEFQMFQFGHLGDGNLHLNAWTAEEDTIFQRRLEQHLYDFLINHGGSISAEHGIGILKAKALEKAKSVEELALMREIKSVLDPNNILNPTKLFQV